MCGATHVIRAAHPHSSLATLGGCENFDDGVGFPVFMLEGWRELLRFARSGALTVSCGCLPGHCQSRRAGDLGPVRYASASERLMLFVIACIKTTESTLFTPRTRKRVRPCSRN